MRSNIVQSLVSVSLATILAFTKINYKFWKNRGSFSLPSPNPLCCDKTADSTDKLVQDTKD